MKYWKSKDKNPLTGKLTKLLFYIPLFFGFYCLQAQELRISFTEKPQQDLINTINNLAGKYRDTLELVGKIQSAKAALYAYGYLFSESELSQKDTLVFLSINPGPRTIQAQPSIKLPKGFAIPELTNAKLNSFAANKKNLEILVEYYLTYLENNGYPFASLNFEDYYIENDTLKGNIAINPGPQIALDSLVIKGFDKFSKNVIRHDLGYKEGMLYSENFLRKLPERTQQVEYLNMVNPPAVAFTKDENILFLYFEEVKSNQIDGVIGLNTEENGDVNLNGDIQLRLLHVFKKGEEFNLRWRRPDESVQTLNFDMEIPYLIKTPFWLEANLSIFRQDSSFVNTDVQGLLKYLLESGSFVSGGINYKSSNVLQALSSGQSTGDFGSFNTVFYKLGLELNKTNRALIPTKGFKVKTYGLTGKRKTSETQQRQYSWQVFGNYYWPLFSTKHILKTGLQTQALFGENLFVNELYRIGGLKTLRGFNEQSIYASSYGIGTLEYRYMIGKYDYLTLFGDFAYAENRAGGAFTSNWFTGLGAGINFETRGGIFSLFYAIGKDDQNPFDVRTSKIHFGYVNRF